MEKLIVKLLAHGLLITALLVLLSNASATGAIFTALFIGIVSYVLGDLVILPRTSNLFATAIDAALVFMALWFVSVTANWTLSLGEGLMITAIAGVFEYIFHLWIRRDFVKT